MFSPGKHIQPWIPATLPSPFSRSQLPTPILWLLVCLKDIHPLIQLASFTIKLPKRLAEAITSLHKIRSDHIGLDHLSIHEEPSISKRLFCQGEVRLTPRTSLSFGCWCHYLFTLCLLPVIISWKKIPSTFLWSLALPVSSLLSQLQFPSPYFILSLVSYFQNYTPASPYKHTHTQRPL